MDYPYVFHDATYCRARVGRREVGGFDLGDSEHEGFWAASLRSMKTRGLDGVKCGVKLAISDAHSGLKKAIATGFQGAGWQRCRVHFMPDVLAVHPKDPRTWSARSSAPPSPNPTLQPCLLRLAGAVIVEQHYGWQARDRLLRREGPLHEAGPAVLAAARAFIAAD